MKTFLKELSLQEGFEVASRPVTSRVVAGKEISLASGHALFTHIHNGGQPIKCWSCGCVADRWVVERHKNDTKNKPVMNLYGVVMQKRRPVLKMMTRDHIIPVSLGGIDTVENLRAGCDDCNRERGNEMNKADLLFMNSNPHLISMERKRAAEERAAVHRANEARRREQNVAEIKQNAALLQTELGDLVSCVVHKTDTKTPRIIFFIKGVDVSLMVQRRNTFSVYDVGTKRSTVLHDLNGVTGYIKDLCKNNP